MLLRLELSGDTPVYQQIRNQVVAAIASGELRPGERLPTIRALAVEDAEIMVIAPYFPEYKVFIEGAGARMVLIPPEIEAFQIDFDAFEKAVTPRTKGVLVNSPNNPSGVVDSRATIYELLDKTGGYVLNSRKISLDGQPRLELRHHQWRFFPLKDCSVRSEIGYLTRENTVLTPEASTFIQMLKDYLLRDIIPNY